MENVTDEPRVCEGLILPLTDESGWSLGSRIALYFVGLIWSFLAVAIIADVFMVSIEVITSRTRLLKIANPDFPGGIEEVEIRIWNDTVANLTLMALGSSAPEILLSIIEIAGNNFKSGKLGPSTIVGSAAFNLLVITAVCIMAIPKGECKGIRMIKVFATTTAFSIFAYIWLYLVLQVISPNKIEIWEAVVTFICFPILVVVSYMFDRDFCGTKKHEPDMELGIAEGSPFLSAGHVDKKAVAEFMREVGRHPDLDESTIAQLIALEAQKHEVHSRSWYRVNASRALLGQKKIEQEVEPRVLELYQKIKNKELPANLPQTDHSAGGTKAVVEFRASSCAVYENEKKVHIVVERFGLMSVQAVVRYETVNGTAEAGSDYIAQRSTLVFEPGETEKIIEIEIIDDNEWEPDETFFVKLAMDPSEEACLGHRSVMQVIIMNDDEPGVFEFTKTSYLIKESAGSVFVPVSRNQGVDGKVEVQWRTKDMEAVNGKDYVGGEGTLVFEHNEKEKEIEIPIIDDQEYEKDESFQIELFEPTGGAQLGRLKKTVVTIINDDDYASILDRVVAITHVNMDRLKLGNASYADQFKDAMNVNGGDVEGAGALDYIMHFLTFGFKVIFAIVPPPGFLNSGGWITFVCALGMIAILTALVGDLASIFGCLINLDASITAITFVALGTSLPDLFASKTAALNEKYADNSIGNVTGSNSVNVFLGLGLPWLIASIYWAAKDDEFIVPAGALAFSVSVYTICAVACIILLMLRRFLRVFGKNELGGPFGPKIGCGVFLISLWVLYILLSSFQVTKYIFPIDE
ncbi:sodium/calcium exchanger 3-like [Acanthaster planci]|uniref:Sodium/calcium exchanger 3-like n=1 Tax=Acanthaster planci TaxID=133434 RepID=A0A8B7YW52_ACAPL|nr:sodium/calcium exchanger 3-like [Acanthaster planci]XP_022095532.1 sodium/calcium exchanger 3-like [Acanthaster planci]